VEFCGILLVPPEVGDFNLVALRIWGCQIRRAEPVIVSYRLFKEFGLAGRVVHFCLWPLFSIREVSPGR
jgi:hypothetical protein